MAEHEQTSETKVRPNSDESNSSSEDSDEFEAADHRSFKTSVRRLFGRERPIHKVLGGGKAAEIVLWRKKNVSGKVFAAATALWFFFEVLGYHFITLVCHALILIIIIVFLWTRACMYIHKSGPHIPEVTIPKDCVLEVVSTLRNEINGVMLGFRNLLRDVTTGKDFKKFLIVIVGLWFLSAIGSTFSFLSLFYICVVFMFTVPMLYEKNEELVDLYGEIVIAEIKKQYAVFDEKVLSQIPIAGSSKKD